MDSNQIDQFLMMNSSKFPVGAQSILRQNLANTNQSTAMMVAAELKDPTIALVLSICTGGWGVDRFYIGDIGLGIGKLITGGGCCIWWLIDIFLIQDAARKKNLETFMMYLNSYGNASNNSAHTSAAYSTPQQPYYDNTGVQYEHQTPVQNVSTQAPPPPPTRHQAPPPPPTVTPENKTDRFNLEKD